MPNKKVGPDKQVEGNIFENQIYVFRNEISPLFKDSASFSSTKFEGSTPAVPNIMWKLDYGTGVLEEKWKFKTKENASEKHYINCKNLKSDSVSDDVFLLRLVFKSYL